MMKNAVIISFWGQRESNPLRQLLAQIRSIEAGDTFDVVVVCNGDSTNLKSDLSRTDLSSILLLERPNMGFNIGAWEYGWRNFAEYDNFLFLQDDCLILRKKWLSTYIKKFYADSQIGLLGESINWQTTWTDLEKSDYNNFHRDHTLDGVKMRRVELYRAFLQQNSLAEGTLADHLQSLILFTSSDILKKIDGFCLGNSYGEAIASEIAISKKVQQAGYKISMIRPNNCFYYFSHPQWEKRKRKIDKIMWRLETWFNL